jgi:hypothetical protein
MHMPSFQDQIYADSNDNYGSGPTLTENQSSKVILADDEFLMPHEIA